MQIDKFKVFDKVGYTPHHEQLRAHSSSARFRTMVCGRRFGKTVVGARELTAALFVPHAYYWIVAPSYALGEKEFRVVRRDIVERLKITPKSMNYNVNQGQMRIVMPWDSVLEVKSAERPESLLGEGLDGVVMAEAARHKRETWEQYIEPALADKRGWALFTSTPRGFNYLYDLFMRDNEYYESWQCPSWLNTAVFPAGLDDPEIQRIKSLVSEQYWKQEYCAEFTTFEGQIYDEFDLELHTGHYIYNPLWRNYLAIDFGFAAPFVCLDVGVDVADNVYVWREYQVRHLTTAQHAFALKQRPQPAGYTIDHVFADPHGADEIATLQQNGMGAVYGPAEISWDVGIEAVKRWLKVGSSGVPKLFIDKSCTELIRQMSNLRMKRAREGKNVAEGQHDYDDHGPDALRYFFASLFVAGGGHNLADVVSSEPDASPFRLDTNITLGAGIAYG